MHGRQNVQSFEAFFCKAVNERPFAFQARFADDLPTLVCVPTGLGKTAMAVVGWLWRRHDANEEIQNRPPRRLVYCLPMRVLVEQTRNNAVEWLKNLREAGFVKHDIPVHVLMGGEDEDDWDIHPERDAIIIGTQDMLLSRALSRGYAASRPRWPMQFGLLHTDCLWVFDEIQLMGSGLATTAQLEAFRWSLPNKEHEAAKNGHGCRSVWMSATLQRDWLNTVDFKDRVDGLTCLELSDDDHKQGEVERRWNAKKPLMRANATMGDASDLANKVRQAHKLGTRTIVVVNTVRRACELFIALNLGKDGQTAKGKKAATKQNSQDNEPSATTTAPTIVLLHSRFRPNDRKKHVDEALAPVQPGAPGTIVVSTQVIEAGVDVSATTLFTELAPWASLVQRFGRCNRRGEHERAPVRWIDLPKQKPEDAARPYELSHLEAAREHLAKMKDVGLGSLTDYLEKLDEKTRKALFPFEHTHVIRRKDLIDLFDTTPDLAGNDIDIDRFVREVEEESDVRVFWRWWDQKKSKTPPDDEPSPTRDELCPAPAWGEWGFREWATRGHGKSKVFRHDFLEGKWISVDSERSPISPGQVYMVHADAGGYGPSLGWTPASNSPVMPPVDPKTEQVPDWETFEAQIRTKEGGGDDVEYDDDGLSRTDQWKSIAQHTDDVCRELNSIIGRGLNLSDAEGPVLKSAARWHDLGKAHPVFQNAVDDGQVVVKKSGSVTRQTRPDEWKGCREVAKAPGKRKDLNGSIDDPGFWRRYDWLPKEGRKYFRHELASALALLQRPHESLQSLTDDNLNLVAYLIAAHHGKVRLSIRSLPNEMRPRDDNGRRLDYCRFARGIWDGDELPATDLGGGITAGKDVAPCDGDADCIKLSLEPMELGLCEREPFKDQPSWAERVIRLRDALGPFRLAYLEAILRAADMRASKAAMNPSTDEGSHQ